MALSLRDRFYTATTAKALLSWRLAVGAVVAVATVFLGLHWALALLVGFAVYTGLVWWAMPKPDRAPLVDPFTVGEPWRQFVQRAQRSARAVHETVNRLQDGPLKDRLHAIAERLDVGIVQVWQIAQRGHQVDDAVRRLDPTGLRSKLTTLERQAERESTANLDAAISSVQSQLGSADRLKARSAETADQLRLTQARLDELAARATEVSIGAADTEQYALDVNELVVEFESLRLAIEETH